MMLNTRNALRALVIIAMALGSLLGLFGSGDSLLAQTNSNCLTGSVSDPLILAVSGECGGQITLSLPAAPRTLNPLLADDDSAQALTGLLHEALLGSNLQPGVTRLKTISPDQREITLELREGLRFSDGRAVTVEDLFFSLGLAFAINPEAWQVPADSEGHGQRELPDVECVDERTVRLITPQLFLPLFDNLARLPVLPKHLLGPEKLIARQSPPCSTEYEDVLQSQAYLEAFTSEWGTDTSPQEYAGLGPFILERSLARSGDAWLVRNPYFFKVDADGQRLPYLEQVTFQVITDENVRILQFLQGNLAAIKSRPQDIPALLEKGDVQVVLQLSFTDSETFVFNQDVNDPDLQRLFRDEGFRHAISLAVDRHRMLDLNLNGFGQVHCGPGVLPHFGVDIPCQFDADGAGQLLDQLGLLDKNGDGAREYPQGFSNAAKPIKFTLLAPLGSEVLVNDADIFAQALRQLGLDVRVEAIDPAALDQRVEEGRFQAARLTLRSEGSYLELTGIWGSCGSRHLWQLSACPTQPGHRSEQVPNWQPQVDRLLDESALGPTEAERRDKLAQFQQVVAEHVPVVFLYRAPDVQAYSKRLGNFCGLSRSATLRCAEEIYLINAQTGS